MSAKIPVVGEYDFVVAGGGMAGFGAACAAAHRGAKTLLIERLEVLGGIGSSGGVGNFSYHGGPPRGQGRVFDEVLAGLEYMNGIGKENGYRTFYQEASQDGQETDNPEAQYFNLTFNHTLLPIVLQHIAESTNVDLLFCTEVVGAHLDGKRIREVLIHNRSLLQAVRGSMFCEATGDGILARHAGAKALPADDPEHPDPIQPAMLLYLHRMDRPQKQPVFESDRREQDTDITYGIWPEPGRLSMKAKMYGQTFQTGTGFGYSEATAAFRRRIPEVVRRFQENYHLENRGGQYALDFAAPMLGIREGRRIEGDYVLTGSDVRAGRKFPDSVAFATSCIDSHLYDEIIPPYQIPYRSLIVKGVDNLLVVGRCFSADRLALSSARVMPTGCLMGQAAGIACAISLREGETIRGIDPAQIRCELLRDTRDRKFMKDHLCS